MMALRHNSKWSMGQAQLSVIIEVALGDRTWYCSFFLQMSLCGTERLGGFPSVVNPSTWPQSSLFLILIIL